MLINSLSCFHWCPSFFFNEVKLINTSLTYSSLFNDFTLASLRRKGPLRVVEFSIDLEYHKDAVPGSVRAFAYLTGENYQIKAVT